MTRWRRIRQIMAATALASLPLTGGVALAHTLDDSVQAVRGLTPGEVDPPGVGLGVELGDRLHG